MFDWIEQIGPNTWAVVVLLIALVVFAALMSRGLGGYLVGGLLSCFAFGAIVSIICFDGTRLPSTNYPVGVAAAIGMAAFLGFNLLVNRVAIAGGSESSRSLRDRVPEYNTKSIVAIVLGVALIGVAVVSLLPSLDLSGIKTDRGISIATREFNGQSDPYFRKLERFLAR